MTSTKVGWEERFELLRQAFRAENAIGFEENLFLLGKEIQAQKADERKEAVKSGYKYGYERGYSHGSSQYEKDDEFNSFGYKQFLAQTPDE